MRQHGRVLAGYRLSAAPNPRAHYVFCLRLILVADLLLPPPPPHLPHNEIKLPASPLMPYKPAHALYEGDLLDELRPFALLTAHVPPARQEQGFPWIVRKTAVKFGSSGAADIVWQSEDGGTMKVVSVNAKGAWQRKLVVGKVLSQRNAAGAMCNTTCWWDGALPRWHCSRLLELLGRSVCCMNASRHRLPASSFAAGRLMLPTAHLSAAALLVTLTLECLLSVHQPWYLNVHTSLFLLDRQGPQDAHGGSLR